MIKAISTSKRNAAKPIAIALLLSAAQFGLSGHAKADTEGLAELRAQLDALQKKVAELEAARGTPVATPTNVVTGGDTKGSFKLPGSNTSVTIGGYAKLDAIWSSRSVGTDNAADQFLSPATIPDPKSENSDWISETKLPLPSAAVM